MKALEILQSYTGMTMKEFNQLPESKSINEAQARLWFRKAYIYSEERLLENATPQQATLWINKDSSLAPFVLNEVCIIGEVMYQQRKG